jgi:hypothetical protein
MRTATVLLRGEFMWSGESGDWSAVAWGVAGRDSGLGRGMPLSGGEAAAETLGVGPAVRTGPVLDLTCEGNATGIFLLWVASGLGLMPLPNWGVGRVGSEEESLRPDGVGGAMLRIADALPEGDREGVQGAGESSKLWLATCGGLGRGAEEGAGRVPWRHLSHPFLSES